MTAETKDAPSAARATTPARDRLRDAIVALQIKAKRQSKISRCIKACRAAVGIGPISTKGHSRHFDGLPMTSGLPSEADIATAGRHVSKVPRSGLMHRGKLQSYSI